MTTALIFGFFNHSYMAVPDSASKPLFPSSEIPTVHICVNRCFSCARAIAGKKNRLRSNTIYAKYKDGTALSRSNRWQGIASPHPHPLPVSGRFFFNIYVLPRCSYVRLPVLCLVGLQGRLASVDHQYCGAGNISFENWLNLV